MRVWVVVLLCLTACGPKLTKLALQDQSQECYLDLMLEESNTVGTYLTRREFNAGLKWECRAPEKAPYPTLFALVDSMKMCHDDALGNRGRYFTTKEELLATFPSKRPQKKEHFIRLAHICDSAHGECAIIDARLEALEAHYLALCAEHRIERITHGEYGASLWARLEQWSDTMEQQGRWIGGGRSLLKGSGLDPLSDAYQSLYAPLSMLQKMHKEFQAQMLLVENQHGRYASSRQDEFYYKGPYLVRRHDVEKTEEEIRNLDRMHVAFMAQHVVFIQGLAEAGLH